MWGSSNDVNTVDKCNKLLDYIENKFGPAIAKYTKSDPKIDNDIFSDTTVSQENTTQLTTTTTIDPLKINVSSTSTVAPDPEFHWDPPENYTEDIVKYVKEELMLNSRYNNSMEDLNTTTINPNSHAFIDSLLHILMGYNESAENMTESYSDISTYRSDKRDVSTTEYYSSTTLDYSTISETTSEYIDTTTVITLSTINPLKENKNEKDYMTTEQTSTEATHSTEKITLDSLKESTTVYYTTTTEEDYRFDYASNETFFDENETNDTLFLNEETTILVNDNDDSQKGEVTSTYKPIETTTRSTEFYETSTYSNDIVEKNKKKEIVRSTNGYDSEDIPDDVNTAFVEQVVF